MVVVLAVLLGQWQLRRASEKNTLQNMRSERSTLSILTMTTIPDVLGDLEYRRVYIQGVFVKNWPIYLDNRPYQGRPGRYVLMPFQLMGTNQYILIARGWIPLNNMHREQIFSYDTPIQTVKIQGVVRQQIGRVLSLGQPELPHPNAVVQNLDIAQWRALSHLDLAPFIVEQSSTDLMDSDHLIRDWPNPSTGVEKHYGYAFQWYALAVMATLFFLVTGCRFRESQKKDNDA